MGQQCSECGSSSVVTEQSTAQYCATCRPASVPSAGVGGDSAFDVCVVGMGYVGSSLAAVLAETGLTVHGIDVDPNVIETVQSGECPLEERRISELFEAHLDAGEITVSGSFDVLDDADTIIVTVGTPLAMDDPDLSAVKAASREVGRHVNVGDLVIYRSTLPAGATEDTILPILEAESGYTAGAEFSLAFCPERMAEGNAYEDLTTLPVVVGGVTDTCQAAATSFWESIGHETVAVSSPRAAELAKLADNWWIDLNIALANEIALLAEAVGVNALEVIRAANTLPKGDHNVNILYPGAGVGGSCLVKDPVFVANLGDAHGLELQTPRVSRTVNDQMPAHMIGLVEQGLGGFDGQTVAVLGYAYKGGTDDTRSTPAKDIIDGLVRNGLEVRVTDPYVPDETIREEVECSVTSLSAALADADAVVIVTGHDEYRAMSPEELIEFVGTEEFAVIDGRHVFEPSAFTTGSTRQLGVGCGTHE